MRPLRTGAPIKMTGDPDGREKETEKENPRDDMNRKITTKTGNITKTPKLHTDSSINIWYPDIINKCANITKIPNFVDINVLNAI